ncbi:hypothetical protein EYF80_014331 [Liparis tanakae]|uniref:Uncharacterized protein n=1 Tax=Liparis tanakae TaxID=230148 RepID=A0A4Z2IBV1_9TELE|nr:hypothetical protein EYF80_014331 [Liparis tanakae]
MLSQLKGAARSLALTSGPQELNQAFVGGPADECGNPSAAEELRDQDDIQIIINQQLRSQQQQTEQHHPLKKSPSNGTSFFRKPSRTASTWSRQASSASSTTSIGSTSWSSDANQGKSQSPWRDWLRRGKGANNGQ